MKTKTKRHKPELIIVKKAKADSGIIPVVNWLNSYSEIQTLHSCEGYTKENCLNPDDHIPYVLFFLHSYSRLSLKQLAEILTLVYPFAKINITYDIEHLGFRYNLHFESIEILDKFKYSTLGLFDA